jgi:secernin
MCDTFVALPDVTVNGGVIFGKNSDRPSDEKQAVASFQSQTYPPDTPLQCTYLTIPQVSQTLAVILSQPGWMWGAEMGANEKGVVIGNEAVWTTQPLQEKGLLGMDLVRLGLERGKSADEALVVITTLLETYGQGGNCAEGFSFNYHNSFLIADASHAWVLETAGKYWVAEKITTGTRSISNRLTIRDAGDRRHPELIAEAVERGLCESEADFDFAQAFAEGGVNTLSPNSRAGRVQQLCQHHEGTFSVDTAKTILRDHQGNICMHGAFISAGSQISRLSPNGCRHWFIEQPFPCQQEYQAQTFKALKTHSA